MTHRTTTPFLAALFLLEPLSARAASPAQCAPTVELHPLQLARQASLDLRGRVPSHEEYESIRDAGDPQAAAEALIDQMLESEDYFAQVREYHRGLLWGSLDDSILPFVVSRWFRIRQSGDLWFLRGGARRRRYRGDRIGCLNQQQTEFDAEGRPVPILVYDDPDCIGGTCRREGWVEVTPYWADAPIKVCAFDAQDAEFGTGGASCKEPNNNPACGCGPALAWCFPDRTEHDEQLRTSLAEEPARIFERIVRGKHSYLDALTTRFTLINGPMAHYYRYQAGAPLEHTASVTYALRMPEIPALPFEDADTWVEVERGAVHSGVLTTLGFLIRFASDRERTNHFYSTFYCDPFLPSDQGLPPEEEQPNPNLRERAGCADCHSVLDAAAAHWGRWRGGGTHGYLPPNALSFDTPREECICGSGTGEQCSFFCNAHFITAENASGEELNLFEGLPQAAAWLEENDFQKVESGPRDLLATEEQRERVSRCTVRKLSEHLLGRPISGDDHEWLEAHVTAFVESGHDFTALARRIIMDERYRSIR